MRRHAWLLAGSLALAVGQSHDWAFPFAANRSESSLVRISVEILRATIRDSPVQADRPLSPTGRRAGGRVRAGRVAISD